MTLYIFQVDLKPLNDTVLPKRREKGNFPVSWRKEKFGRVGGGVEKGFQLRSCHRDGRTDRASSRKHF